MPTPRPKSISIHSFRIRPAGAIQMPTHIASTDIESVTAREANSARDL
jgi:hypothetical protein